LEGRLAVGGRPQSNAEIDFLKKNNFVVIGYFPEQEKNVLNALIKGGVEAHHIEELPLMLHAPTRRFNLDPVFRNINHAFERKKPVFLFCVKGRAFSHAIAALYLIEKCETKYDDAVERVLPENYPKAKEVIEDLINVYIASQAGQSSVADELWRRIRQR
jgi:hypothetical protein